VIIICCPAAHNNAELPILSAQASQDSFWSETASQQQAQELQQLRNLQQLQMLQQSAYDVHQPASQIMMQRAQQQ